MHVPPVMMAGCLSAAWVGVQVQCAPYRFGEARGWDVMQHILPRGSAFILPEYDAFILHRV